jgi:pilus assembly protein FimV
MTVRSTSRAPVLRTVADAPHACGAAVRIAAATVFAIAVATTVFASPRAFAADSASAAAAASAPGAESATRFTVKPGQSLNDVAVAVTQSHDRAVLSRASKAIFDANPSSFMRGDPSLMKLGAVLTIPPLDSTGAVVAQAPAPGSVPGAATAPAAAAASAPRGAAPAPSAVAASSGASVPARGAGPEASPVGGASASAPAASAPGVPAPPRAAAQSPNGAAPASTPAAPAAGGAHAWTGAIQQAPTVPAASETSGASRSAASAPAAASTAAVATAPASAPATAARPHPFSSLQQLLAFKNRVLMDLQRHGFGPKAERESGSSAAASGASVVVPSQAPKQTVPAAVPAPRAPQSGERFIGIGGYGISIARGSVPAIAAVASAIVAALLVLIVALAMSGRKRRAARAAAAPPPASGTASAGAAVEREPVPAHAEGPRDPVEAEYLSTLARTPTSKRALMGLAGHYAERGNARGFDEIAQRIMHLSGGRGPNWLHIAALGRQLDPHNPLYAVSAEQAADTLDESVAGEDALPSHSAQAQSGEHEPDVEVKLSGAGHSGLPAESSTIAAEDAESSTHAAAEEPGAPHEDELAVRPAPAPESGQEASSGQRVAPPEERTVAGMREPRFPEEAIAALNDLDLGLPPRVEAAPEHGAERTPRENGMAEMGAAEGIEPGFTAEREDASGPEPKPEPHDVEAHLSARDAEPRHEPGFTDHDEHEHEHGLEHEPEPDLGRDPEPHAAPAPEVVGEPESPQKTEHEPTHEPTHEPVASAAIPPAVAGLGAARFGPLKLAFDLDLPADDSTGAAASTPPQPAFTPEEIARIARNKLELAAEYIELGDLGGARTLIHEVIESNDPATRDEARALLATLAPLS